VTPEGKDRPGPHAEVEFDDDPAEPDVQPDLPEAPLEDIEMTLTWQASLSEYLNAELHHSGGAYRDANDRLREVQSFLDTQRGDDDLVRSARDITKTGLELNDRLERERHAAIDTHRLPAPPADLLDVEAAATDHLKRVRDFYEIARGALRATSGEKSPLAITRRAILLDFDTEYDIGRLQLRYTHRERVAHDVLGFEAPTSEGLKGAASASSVAQAGLSNGGAMPAHVLIALTQAHLDLHRVEHRRSLSVGGMLSRTDAQLKEDRQTLKRSIALNTFTYASSEAMPWLFSSGTSERDTIQTDPRGVPVSASRRSGRSGSLARCCSSRCIGEPTAFGCSATTSGRTTTSASSSASGV
jgi:hypothetical protein